MRLLIFIHSFMRTAFSAFFSKDHWRFTLTLFSLGFSSGLPYLLIFSTLSLWLLEAGVERKMVTMFSWAALAYSFKFIWSPLIDTLPLPFLTRLLGKRRAWLLLAQSLIITAVIIMAFTNPQPDNTHSLNIMALSAVLLGFSAATQDVVIDAYRIEIAPDNHALQSTLAAAYTTGYRIAMVASGAGSLLLAAHFGSSNTHYLYTAWRDTYLVMAALLSIGWLTTLLIREPQHTREHTGSLNALDNLRLLSLFILSVGTFILFFRISGNWLPETKTPLSQFFSESAHLLFSLFGALLMGYLCVFTHLTPKELALKTWYSPLANFFQRYGKKALILLALIGLYRISDIVAGVISNVFYADLGFSKEEIAWAVKTFGVIMSIIGGFAGGFFTQKIRIMNMMMIGALATAITNLFFVALAIKGHDIVLMYFAIGVDNFAAGLATTVFVAFLSSLTNIRFTAVQYALFSSLMTLFPKVLGGYSGSIVDSIGYTGFFSFCALLGMPILLLVWWADKALAKA